MFSLFKKKPVKEQIFDSVHDSENATIIDSRKMTLEERKSWRQQLLRNSIKEFMDSLEISGSMYRYRIMPLDDRWHIFAVMFETTRYFMLCKYMENSRLIEIEQKLKNYSYTNYGVTIDAVYWRATETIDVFDNAAKRALPTGKHKKTIDDLREEFKNKIPISDSLNYTNPSKNEIESFKAAIEKGVKPTISGKFYDTDLSPLGPN